MQYRHVDVFTDRAYSGNGLIWVGGPVAAVAAGALDD